MNYFVHQQHREYDPSLQNQESYDQSTNNYYYSYSFSYSNPQFTTSIHPYSYQNPVVQPSHHEEQEPNPPGVTPPPPPPPELSQNPYYLHHAQGGAARVPTLGPQPGAVDTCVPAVVHQPIVQPLYGGVGIMNGTVPGGDAHIHLGPKLNVSSYPFRVDGHGGGGHAQPMNAATPFQDQTIIAHGGLHIQGGPSQLLSQSYGETHHIPRPKVSGRKNRARGRGKGCAQSKRATAPDVDRKLFTQGKSAELASVLPPPKVVSCELCKVECNTLEILQQHMNGKKHKKKLKVFEELQNINERVICRRTEQTSTIELKSEVLPQPDRVEGSGTQQLQPEVLPSQEINEESKVAGEKRKVEEVEPPEESAKKMRVDHAEHTGHVLKRKLRGGKSNRKKRTSDRAKRLVQPPEPKQVAPLVCELCNVKCESLVVFQSHLVGKKHKSKAKRFLGQDTFGQVVQRPEMQAVNQNSADASTSIGFGAYGVASAQNIMITGGQGSTFADNMTTAGEVEA
ncbi:putative endonuclease or glycosyl hydrolase with C2H2-type zinc finger domain-containing protein [Perilla frutescens var. hirtella]|uniref:Endonuclease or glycosyl hydrolase with C2H2-type zinc finger domain-containing protein n=1 Tax=Perilla frutescens var. hirtella TaxID=608512 RepID=A0AAD4IYM5_PERFH|nr:putative endonuclease or glycosyl hydrolase with C2H2-type zinc finger domain-containing protein [Perilla frutescens var. hirtella]